MKLNGDLDAEGLPVVLLRVRGPFGSRELQVNVDTCFGSTLSVPESVAKGLGLPTAGRIPIADARGSVRIEVTCDCQIMWDGSWRDLEVVISTGPVSLLGARLMHGHKLTIDYGPARTVEIE